MLYGTYRSNAVVLTHIPTGIRAICSEHRSQHKNRDSAWKRLCSLLYLKERVDETRRKTNTTNPDMG